MAATAVAAAAAAAASSASRPLCNKLPNFASDHSYSLASIAPQFARKTKPIKPLKLKTQYPFSQPFSLLFPSILFQASAAFDNVDVVAENGQSTELSETETAIEEEEEEQEEGEGDDTSKDNDDQSETNLDEAGRLYVGNLPFSMTSYQLEQIFGEAGRVASVEIVYDRVTDRSRGFAFVTMGSVEDAKEAIRMFDGSEVGGRTVKVNFPEVPRGGERKVMGLRIRSSNQGFLDSPHKIYAGNLSWGLTSQGLREAFAGQPGLLSAKVVYERGSGRSRGFGFITFESAEELESALSAMNGVEVDGRPIRLNMAEERAPPTP